jgi:hypothetical protein
VGKGNDWNAPQCRGGQRSPMGRQANFYICNFSLRTSTGILIAYVLVQPEMERERFPLVLVSIPPFGRGFSRHRYNH